MRKAYYSTIFAFLKEKNYQTHGDKVTLNYLYLFVFSNFINVEQQ